MSQPVPTDICRPRGVNENAMSQPVPTDICRPREANENAMSQPIPMDVCRQREENENEMEQTVKFLEQKLKNAKLRTELIKKDVENLDLENALWDKKIAYTDLQNAKLEKEINSLKVKTEEVARKKEAIQWKIYKTELLKEFEDKRYDEINKKTSQYEQTLKNKCVSNKEPSHSSCVAQEVHNNEQGTNLKMEMKLKIKELTDEINKKKLQLQMADPNKLHTDIQMLKNRNAALLLRYQRQCQEARSRLRQARSELASLRRLSLEKSDRF